MVYGFRKKIYNLYKLKYMLAISVASGAGISFLSVDSKDIGKRSDEITIALRLLTNFWLRCGLRGHVRDSLNPCYILYHRRPYTSVSVTPEKGK